ncbi:RICIN domain-containing protein [Streptomyces sp. NPDC093228]|uniref:RICIN domain-containing protein n=1 Tax=Streptomyces sp. NPDC093228 TaxID=3155070 RepID=UPI00341801B7
MYPLVEEAHSHVAVIAAMNFQRTGDEVPPQSKKQELELPDGKSSRFAAAFTQRMTQFRQGKNPAPRPWTWVVGAVALSACVVLIVFAVAKFSPGSSGTQAKASASASLSASASPSTTAPATLSASRSADRRGSSAGQGDPGGSKAIVHGAPSPSGGGGTGGGTPQADPVKQTETTNTGSTSGTLNGARMAGTPPKPQATSYPGVLVVGHASGRCVTATGAQNGTARDGTRLELWDCAGGSWQTIDFRSDGTARMFGLCMDIAGASQDDGTAIQLANCNGGWAQRFKLNSSYDLVNTAIGKCVDAYKQGTSNGTVLQLWRCNGQSNQKWSKD